MTDPISRYLYICIEQLTQLRDRSAEAIDAAAHAVADAIQAGRSYFLFGSGHSALIAHEAFWRAGGLAPAMPIPDPSGGDAERLSGYGAVLLGHYDLQPGDVIVVISNSGINPLPVEIAIECKERGLTVIAITCLAHSQAVPSRHAGGKKLYEVADIVIDTQGVPGDAALELPGVPGRIGPTSTVLGAAIVEAISVQAAALLAERGIVPPVLISSNLPEGDKHNRKLIEQYRGKLIRYEVPTVDASPIKS
jgi:uncharacterized phosphosugar-binding protein